MSDTLSGILRAVRLSGAVFFTVDATAPWATETPEGKAIAPRLALGGEHVIDYHIVRSGSCWGGIVGQPAIRLEAGDVIVFPHGDTHVMSSEPGLRGHPDVELYSRPITALPTAICANGGSRERTQVVCGFLACEARPFNPLLATLPRVIHVPAGADDGGLVPQLVNLALLESSNARPGSECMLAYLSELLFVEVVRRHLSRLPAEERSWLAGLRDEHIGRALARLHERPTHNWTLEELAREVGLSRSTLAERFTQFVGVPPMQYLANWRMQLASGLLSNSSKGIAEVALNVGYGSEAAFSRAFKRLVGVAPAMWRQNKRASV